MFRGSCVLLIRCLDPRVPFNILTFVRVRSHWLSFVYHRAVQENWAFHHPYPHRSHRPTHRLIFCPDPLSLRDIGLVYIILFHDSQSNHQDGDQVIDTFDTLVSPRTALSANGQVQDGGPFVVASDESKARACRQLESKHQC